MMAKKSKPLISTTVLWVAGVLMTLVTAWNLLVLFWFPAEFAGYQIFGRNPLCPWHLAQESQQRLEERRVRWESFKSRMRLLETDGRLQKWATPNGPMWLTASKTIDPFGEPEIVRWYRIQGQEEPPVREGDVVIDCGGHVGDSTHADSPHARSDWLRLPDTYPFSATHP